MNSTPSPISLRSESRIELLDGFRCLAAMWVVIYHYYWRYVDVPDLSYYPKWSFSRYGYFGVQLFFMISGFVIYYSLERTTSIKEFLTKRYLRLAPTLIFCSILTYVAVNWWNDSPRIGEFESKTPLDFLFSFTFISPMIWRDLLGREDIKFVDGVYWSLWPEVIFYISASIVYFTSRKENFLRNWSLLVLVLWMLRVCTSPKLAGITPDFLLPLTSAYYKAFLFITFHLWAYFTVGVICYELWMKRKVSLLVWIIAAILFLMEMYFIAVDAERVLFPAAILLWVVFLLRPQWLGFLRWRPIQVIGLISYPLYLLHEGIGIVVSEKILKWTNHSIPVIWVLIMVLVIIILLSYFVFVFFEKPVTRALKGKLLGNKITPREHAAGA